MNETAYLPYSIPYPGTFGNLFFTTTTNNTITLPGAGKQDHMGSNDTKYQYEVTLSDGTVEIVEADSVEESTTRVKFLKADSYNGRYEVLKSYRDALVNSYRQVPVQEQNDEAVGKNTYRFTLSDGTSKDVQGDCIMFQSGSTEGAGRYSVVTDQKNKSTGRTEYMVPENRVSSIERVTPQADVPEQGTPAEVSVVDENVA